MQAAPTRSAPPAALEPDEELEVRLESELPARLAIGTGNAVFVYGSCFHRRRRVVKLWLLAGDRRVRPIAFAMPRRDLPVYRSAFWGIVPFEPVARRETVRLRVGAELDDARAVVGGLARIELEPAGPTEAVAWRDGHGEDELARHPRVPV